MNHEEAKDILRSYRPDSADAGDPIFAEALALARRDAALGEWFAREQALDRGLSADYEAMPVPADLRGRILAEARGARNQPVRPFWPRPATWGAMAASLAVLGAFSLALWSKPRQSAGDSRLADVAIADAQHPKTHGGHGEETAALNRLLKEPTTRIGDPLPVDYATLRAVGCRIVPVEGHEVLEVCFKRNGVGLHYYIARREDFPALAATKTPVLVDKPQASLAVWADKTNLYLVVTQPDRKLLEKLL